MYNERRVIKNHVPVIAIIFLLFVIMSAHYFDRWKSNKAQSVFTNQPAPTTTMGGEAAKQPHRFNR